MSDVPFYAVCADFYDADYEAAGRLDDATFYTELARQSGGPVLEMGCGSGRVLLPTARAGVEVVGMDVSPDMLVRLARRLEYEPEEVRRRVELVEADVRAADLGRRFPLVTAPFRVIQHLVERDDQRAWLRTVARHLAPGGALVFDVFQPDYSMVTAPPSTHVDLERTDPETGRLVQRLATAWHTPERQVFRVRFEWREVDEDDAAASEPPAPSPDGTSGAAHADGPRGGRDEDAADPLAAAETEVRWFTRAELENLLELEGFRVTDAWGDFDRTAYGPGAEEIILRAVRRQEPSP